jgi:hypothetical protein
VIEGPASWVDDRDLLEQIASAHDSKYAFGTNDNLGVRSTRFRFSR